MSKRARLRAWLHAWLIALDQLAYVTFDFWACVMRGHPVPSPYETISSKVGRRARRGAHWALLAESAIDSLFMLLGSAPGHCRRSIIRADWLTANLP